MGDTPTFDFRIRFETPQGRRLMVDDAQLLLFEDDASVVYLASSTGKSIGKSETLQVRGTAYETELVALETGEDWKARLRRAFACVGIGADFGDRGPGSGGLTPIGRQMAEEAIGRPVRNDVHGVMAYLTDPRTVFYGGRSRASLGVPADRFVRAVQSVHNRPWGARESMAAALYGSAQFTGSSTEARFISLMMAVEALIDQQPRSQQVRALVDEFVSRVQEEHLPADVAKSLVGSLGWLKVESVSGAGKRLAQQLEGRTYAKRSPETFFAECYSVRSALMHGREKRPTHSQVARLAAHLNTFVGDLLAGPDLLADVSEAGAS